MFSEPRLILLLPLSQPHRSWAIKESAGAYALSGKDRQREYSNFLFNPPVLSSVMQLFQIFNCLIPVEGIPQSKPLSFFLYPIKNFILAVNFLSLQTILTLTCIDASSDICFTSHLLCFIPQKCELLHLAVILLHFLFNTCDSNPVPLFLELSNFPMQLI